MLITALTATAAFKAPEALFKALESAQQWEDYKGILKSLDIEQREMLQTWLKDGKQLIDQGKTTKFGVAVLALNQIKIFGIESLDKASQSALLWEALRLDEARKEPNPGSPLEEVVKRAATQRPPDGQTRLARAACALALGIAFLFGGEAKAQLIVTDPLEETATLIKNVEDGLSWASSLENDLVSQANQITQITNQVQQITQIEDQLRRLGDPSALTGILNGAKLPQLANIQPSFANIKVSLDGAAALADTGNGLYRAVTNVSLAGNTVKRDLSSYRQYDMMRQIRQQHEQNSTAYEDEAKALQDEIKATMMALDAAATDTEIKKYHAKLSALQAQQQALSDQLHKAALDSTVQKNDMEANRQMQQQAAAEAYDADADAAMQANRNATLPQPVYQGVHVK